MNYQVCHCLGHHGRRTCIRELGTEWPPPIEAADRVQPMLHAGEQDHITITVSGRWRFGQISWIQKLFEYRNKTGEREEKDTKLLLTPHQLLYKRVIVHGRNCWKCISKLLWRWHNVRLWSTQDYLASLQKIIPGHDITPIYSSVPATAASLHSLGIEKKAISRIWLQLWWKYASRKHQIWPDTRRHPRLWEQQTFNPVSYTS